MTPKEFLAQEYGNVRRVLTETLRHEYAPERSEEYYAECADRLKVIKHSIDVLSPSDQATIAAQFDQLGLLATFISLFERSRLGEFSWPFADVVRGVADKLLAEQDLRGDERRPIIHVVSEGRGYRIVNERLSPTSSKRRLVVVVFPRPLKHHVLLHAIFGHELGHTALFTSGADAILKRDVVTALTSSGPMHSSALATQWLNDPNAPQEIRSEIARFRTASGPPLSFPEKWRTLWLKEFICDLFGLVLFGPAFLAAHRAILQALRPTAFTLRLESATHPPYALRQVMLAQALRAMGWDRPVTGGQDTKLSDAEQNLIAYISHDAFPNWAQVFTAEQIEQAVTGIRQVFAGQPELCHTRCGAEELRHLVTRLARGLPPIAEEMTTEGRPTVKQTSISTLLYAGWVYWFGRGSLDCEVQLTFLDTNHLCDHALLQQSAINIGVDAGGLQ